MRRFLRETLQTLVLAGIVFLLLQSTLQNFRVEGSSMEPTLKHGEYLVVNKARYLRIPIGRLFGWLPFVPLSPQAVWEPFRGPRPGDVVVFHYPRDPQRDFVKRVVAGPGDKVEIRSGIVFVNDRPLHEPYIKNPGTFTMNPLYLRADEYFVLGDNRPLSNDSRSWGPLHRRYIIGKAWITYWPLSRIGLISVLVPRGVSTRFHPS
ncbi:MAG: signal peptidase I [Dehalococcoidia bacterium]|nr:signal peptidase I [Dehalococcoidia bacterium]MDW8119708.1 signal peptidase I [Chloroflexota bacterium]